MFDTDTLLQSGGLLLLALSVYCQTGLFFCFFIPSGGFLFAAGVYLATGELPWNIFLVSGLLILASVLGNMTGYWVGLRAGQLMYKREESRFFRRRHLEKADAFYKKYGRMTLITGMLLPVTRTFAPIVAGIIKLEFRSFLGFITLGSVLWVVSFLMTGYLIGSVPVLKPYLKYIIMGIIVAVTLPVISGIIRNFNGSEKEASP